MNYKILDLIQGSEEWHGARFEHITATDIPIILNANPWKTKDDLLRVKIDRSREYVDEVTQSRFDLGHQSEETARKILRDYKFKPLVLTSISYPWLLASLDGFDLEKNVILEAKWTGNVKKLRDAKKGIISLDHELQIQAQLLISGANYCLYHITDGLTYARQVVKPDMDMWPDIIKESKEVWDLIKELRNG